MNTTTTAYHQIGKYIFLFQHVEAEVKEILVLLTNADSEAVRILIDGLEYSKLLTTTDVMFSRFIDLQSETDPTVKDVFHKLMNKLGKLAKRRNDIVHSKYTDWVNIAGNSGLIRENSKLRASKGIREKQEEEILPDTFNSDFNKLSDALQSLNEFRLKIIDLRYPDVQPEPCA